MNKPIVFSLSTFLFMLVLLGLATVSSQASHVDCDLFLEITDYAPSPPDIHDIRGHGGGYTFLPTTHGHGIVKLYGFGLFIIRAADRTVVPAIAIPPRLGKVCKQLDEAIERLEENPNLLFKIDRHRGRLSIVQVSQDGDHHEKIINIVPGDAIGYKSRDVHGRNISPELVAQYWLAVLEDTVSVFVLSKEPEKLTYTHAGEVLQAIYKLARQEQSSGRISEEVFEDTVLNKLTHEQKEHLGALAFYIPGEFPLGSGIVQPREEPEEEHDEHESETEEHEEITNKTEPEQEEEHDDESEPVPLPIDIISIKDNSPLASLTKTESTLKITAPTSISDKIDLTNVSVEVFSKQDASLYQMSISVTGHPPQNFMLALPEEGTKGEVFAQGNTVSFLVKGRYNGKEAKAEFTGITISPPNGNGGLRKVLVGLVLLNAVAAGLFFLLRKLFGSKQRK